MELWDTRTRQCIKQFGNRKIPYVVKIDPNEEKQHILWRGCQIRRSSRSVYTVHLAHLAHLVLLLTSSLTVQYKVKEDHLGVRSTPEPMKKITCVDNNRRFGTTSDDKTVRAWNCNVPVVIK
jgi:pre-mRNA-processing factor 17